MITDSIKTTTTTKPKALEVMAGRINVDPAKLLDTLKATVFKGATSEELLALVVVANEYCLNPFLREIYAFPAKGGGITPVVSVDGWNKMLIRQPGFDGIEFEMTDGAAGLPHSCTATIHVKDRSHPVKITEYFSECARSTDPWKQMPRRMLRHKALIQASRVAFGFSGVHDPDDAIDIQSTIIEPPPKHVLLESVPEASKTDEPPAQSPQVELESIVLSAGLTFDDLMKWGKDTGHITEFAAENITCFEDVPSKVATMLVRARAGLVHGLKKQKDGAK